MHTNMVCTKKKLHKIKIILLIEFKKKYFM